MVTPGLYNILQQGGAVMVVVHTALASIRGTTSLWPALIGRAEAAAAVLENWTIKKPHQPPF